MNTTAVAQENTFFASTSTARWVKTQQHRQYQHRQIKSPSTRVSKELLRNNNHRTFPLRSSGPSCVQSYDDVGNSVANTSYYNRVSGTSSVASKLRPTPKSPSLSRHLSSCELSSTTSSDSEQYSSFVHTSVSAASSLCRELSASAESVRTVVRSGGADASADDQIEVIHLSDYPNTGNDHNFTTSSIESWNSHPAAAHPIIYHHRDASSAPTPLSLLSSKQLEWDNMGDIGYNSTRDPTSAQTFATVRETKQPGNLEENSTLLPPPMVQFRSLRQFLRYSQDQESHTFSKNAVSAPDLTRLRAGHPQPRFSRRIEQVHSNDEFLMPSTAPDLKVEDRTRARVTPPSRVIHPQSGRRNLTPEPQDGTVDTSRSPVFSRVFAYLPTVQPLRDLGSAGIQQRRTQSQGNLGATTTVDSSAKVESFNVIPTGRLFRNRSVPGRQEKMYLAESMGGIKDGAALSAASLADAVVRIPSELDLGPAEREYEKLRKVVDRQKVSYLRRLRQEVDRLARFEEALLLARQNTDSQLFDVTASWRTTNRAPDISSSPRHNMGDKNNNVNENKRDENANALETLVLEDADNSISRASSAHPDCKRCRKHRDTSDSNATASTVESASPRRKQRDDVIKASAVSEPINEPDSPQREELNSVSSNQSALFNNFQLIAEPGSAVIRDVINALARTSIDTNSVLNKDTERDTVRSSPIIPEHLPIKEDENYVVCSDCSDSESNHCGKTQNESSPANEGLNHLAKHKDTKRCDTKHDKNTQVTPSQSTSGVVSTQRNSNSFESTNDDDDDSGNGIGVTYDLRIRRTTITYDRKNSITKISNLDCHPGLVNKAEETKLERSDSEGSESIERGTFDVHLHRTRVSYNYQKIVERSKDASNGDVKDKSAVHDSDVYVAATSKHATNLVEATPPGPCLAERKLSRVFVSLDSKLPERSNVSESETGCVTCQTAETPAIAWELPVVGDQPKAISLQEAFQLRCGHVIRNSKSRLENVAKLKEKRFFRDEVLGNYVASLPQSRRKVVANQLHHSNEASANTRKQPLLPPRPKLSYREMREQTEKVYQRLPEVIEKKKRMQRQGQYHTNRVMQQIYANAMHDKVLRGRTNFHIRKPLVQ